MSIAQHNQNTTTTPEQEERRLSGLDTTLREDNLSDPLQETSSSTSTRPPDTTGAPPGGGGDQGGGGFFDRLRSLFSSNPEKGVEVDGGSTVKLGGTGLTEKQKAGWARQDDGTWKKTDSQIETDMNGELGLSGKRTETTDTGSSTQSVGLTGSGSIKETIGDDGKRTRETATGGSGTVTSTSTETTDTGSSESSLGLTGSRSSQKTTVDGKTTSSSSESSLGMTGRQKTSETLGDTTTTTDGGFDVGTTSKTATVGDVTTSSSSDRIGGDLSQSIVTKSDTGSQELTTAIKGSSVGKTETDKDGTSSSRDSSLEASQRLKGSSTVGNTTTTTDGGVKMGMTESLATDKEGNSTASRTDNVGGDLTLGQVRKTDTGSQELTTAIKGSTSGTEVVDKDGKTATTRDSSLELSQRGKDTSTVGNTTTTTDGGLSFGTTESLATDKDGKSTSSTTERVGGDLSQSIVTKSDTGSSELTTGIKGSRNRSESVDKDGNTTSSSDSSLELSQRGKSTSTVGDTTTTTDGGLKFGTSEQSTTDKDGNTTSSTTDNVGGDFTLGQVRKTKTGSEELTTAIKGSSVSTTATDKDGTTSTDESSLELSQRGKTSSTVGDTTTTTDGGLKMDMGDKVVVDKEGNTTSTERSSLGGDFTLGQVRKTDTGSSELTTGIKGSTSSVVLTDKDGTTSTDESSLELSQRGKSSSTVGDTTTTTDGGVKMGTGEKVVVDREGNSTTTRTDSVGGDLTLGQVRKTKTGSEELTTAIKGSSSGTETTDKDGTSSSRESSLELSQRGKTSSTVGDTTTTTDGGVKFGTSEKTATDKEGNVSSSRTDTAGGDFTLGQVRKTQTGSEELTTGIKGSTSSTTATDKDGTTSTDESSVELSQRGKTSSTVGDTTTTTDGGVKMGVGEKVVVGKDGTTTTTNTDTVGGDFTLGQVRKTATGTEETGTSLKGSTTGTQMTSTDGSSSESRTSSLGMSSSRKTSDEQGNSSSQSSSLDLGRTDTTGTDKDGVVSTSSKETMTGKLSQSEVQKTSTGTVETSSGLSMGTETSKTQTGDETTSSDKRTLEASQRRKETSTVGNTTTTSDGGVGVGTSQETVTDKNGKTSDVRSSRLSGDLTETVVTTDEDGTKRESSLGLRGSTERSKKTDEEGTTTGRTSSLDLSQSDKVVGKDKNGNEIVETSSRGLKLSDTESTDKDNQTTGKRALEIGSEQSKVWTEEDGTKRTDSRSLTGTQSQEKGTDSSKREASLKLGSTSTSERTDETGTVKSSVTDGLTLSDVDQTQKVDGQDKRTQETSLTLGRSTSSERSTTGTDGSKLSSKETTQSGLTVSDGTEKGSSIGLTSKEDRTQTVVSGDGRKTTTTGDSSSTSLSLSEKQGLTLDNTVSTVGTKTTEKLSDKTTLTTQTGTASATSSVGVNRDENGNLKATASAKADGTVIQQSIKHGFESRDDVMKAVEGLQRGAEGPKVLRLQQILRDKGFDTNGLDGKFGPGTERALKAFQKANKLTETGLVDAATSGLLAPDGLFTGGGTLEAEWKALSAKAEAKGEALITPDQLKISGSAGASATLIGGSAKLDVPVFGWKMFDEPMDVSMTAGVSASVLAEAKGQIGMDVSKGSNLQAQLSGGGEAFAGAKAGVELGAKLRWKRRSDYSKELKEFAKSLPLGVDDYLIDKLPEDTWPQLSKLLMGSGPTDLVAAKVGVEGSAGIGAKANFAGSLSGGRVKLEGALAATIGLGAGIKPTVELGILDGIRLAGALFVQGKSWLAEKIPIATQWLSKTTKAVQQKIDDYMEAKKKQGGFTGALATATDFIGDDLLGLW